MSYGGCGEVANTTGCEPVIREFDSRQPPHNSRIGLIQCYQAFFVAKIAEFMLKMRYFALKNEFY